MWSATCSQRSSEGSTWGAKHLYTILPYIVGYLLTCLDLHMSFSDIIPNQYDVGPPSAARTASTLLGRLSTRFRSVCFFFLLTIFPEAHWWSHTDVGPEGLALSLRSDSSQRCSIGLRSGLCAGQSSSSTPDSAIHVFMDLALCSGAQSCWSQAQLLKNNLTP